MTASYEARWLIPGDTIRVDRRDITITAVTGPRPDTSDMMITGRPAGHPEAAPQEWIRRASQLVTVTTAATRPRRTP